MYEHLNPLKDLVSWKVLGGHTLIENQTQNYILKQ